INDFDEVHPGPWEWDLKRLAASAAVAGRFMDGDKAHGEAEGQGTGRAHSKRQHRTAAIYERAVWYESIAYHLVTHARSPALRRNAARIFDKAKRKGHGQVLDKLTEHVDGEHRIVEDPPLIVRESHSDGGLPIMVALDRMLHAYTHSVGYGRKALLSRYRIVD